MCGGKLFHATPPPHFSTNISICHTRLGCKKRKEKKESIYHSAAVVQDSLYYQLHTIPTKPCERKGTVAVWRRSVPVIYFSSLLRRRSQCAGICVRLDHPCWISPQMFFALERRVERNGNYFALQQIDVAQLLLCFTFSCFLNSRTAWREGGGERRSASQVKLGLCFFVFFLQFSVTFADLVRVVF